MTKKIISSLGAGCLSRSLLNRFNGGRSLEEIVDILSLDLQQKVVADHRAEALFAIRRAYNLGMACGKRHIDKMREFSQYGKRHNSGAHFEASHKQESLAHAVIEKTKKDYSKAMTKMDVSLEQFEGSLSVEIQRLRPCLMTQGEFRIKALLSKEIDILTVYNRVWHEIEELLKVGVNQAEWLLISPFEDAQEFNPQLARALRPAKPLAVRSRSKGPACCTIQ